MWYYTKLMHRIRTVRKRNLILAYVFFIVSSGGSSLLFSVKCYKYKYIIAFPHDCFHNNKLRWSYYIYPYLQILLSSNTNVHVHVHVLRMREPVFCCSYWWFADAGLCDWCTSLAGGGAGIPCSHTMDHHLHHSHSSSEQCSSYWVEHDPFLGCKSV